LGRGDAGAQGQATYSKYGGAKGKRAPEKRYEKSNQTNEKKKGIGSGAERSSCKALKQEREKSSRTSIDLAERPEK